MRRREESPSYELFMLALCLYALGSLAVEAVTPLSPATRVILHHADYGVCAIFFADFCVTASFAMLGDLNLAGPRVIEQIIRQ
ncbi:hypothetical protein FJY94_08745 [Candidatus Kaiserbacteria bacterium]|nr:hypothetical protein [Candidatus Kaiserbacteria bacterium]